MFGYIVPLKGELKIKNYNLYQAFYCGVCRSLGSRYGLKSRFLLNYDIAFLAVFLSAVNPDYHVKPGRCAVKRFKKQLFAYGDSIDLAADLNVLLAYYKLKDNKADDKSFAAFLGCLVYALSAAKAGKHQEKMEYLIKKMTQELSELEKLECWSVDVAAIPFSNMLGEILEEASGIAGYKDHERMNQFGKELGKWIYMIDAIDDFDEDVKKDRYNPYKYIENGQNLKEPGIFMCLQALTEIYAEIEFSDLQLKEIIDNILYAGMMNRIDIVLEKGSCEDESVRNSWCKRKCQ